MRNRRPFRYAPYAKKVNKPYYDRAFTAGYSGAAIEHNPTEQAKAAGTGGDPSW